MKIEEKLSGRIGMDDVRRLVEQMRQGNGATLLFRAAESANVRVARNALWIMTHLQPHLPERFQLMQNQLIDRVLQESNVSKKRMLLQILRRTEFDPADPRADFLDFCLEKITDEAEPYAVRANCIHISRKLCAGYAELRAELAATLSHLTSSSTRTLSPGLRSALRQKK